MAELELFPDDPPEYEEIAVTDIDERVPDAVQYTIPPSRKMLNSVRKFGILEPILLIRKKSGNKFDIAAGRRRIAAAKATERASIPARIFPWGWTIKGVLTLVENECRSSNDLAEWAAVRECLDKGKTEEEIMKLTGVGPERLKALMRLDHLPESLRQAFLEGKITPKVAERASKQKPKVQKRLAKILKETGQLRNEDISTVRKAIQSAAVAQLPDDLFTNLEDWRAVCLDKLAEVRTEMLGRAPDALMNELDSLMSNIQRTVVATPATADPAVPAGV